MHGATKSNTIATGLAMFSMLFGAGNVVFPLALGQYAQSQTPYAFLGFVITAVIVPFIGLMAMTLFNGNYRHFFDRVGKVPGMLLVVGLLGLVGPFGAMPRIITVAYASIKLYVPTLSLGVFGIISTAIIFALTFRKSRILDILGYVLTPLLMISLALIIMMGILTSPATLPSDLTRIDAFVHGVTRGYLTMDLFGAFFFVAMVLQVLEKGIAPSDKDNVKKTIFMTLKAGCIGISLLGLVYGGFGYVASHFSESLASSNPEEMLAVLARQILGSKFGVIACIAVALACLTTAMALAVVFTEFLHEDIFQEKIGYLPCLVMTLIVNFFMSLLNFVGILRLLVPILMVCYPALILLSILNIGHKVYHIQTVKTPVFVVFAISLAAYLWW